MTDESTRQLKSWTYVHRVEEGDLNRAVERFRTQIENVSEHLEAHEDLKPPFVIEAQIQIVDVQEDNQEEEIDKVSLFDWGDDTG
jgi:hypothetical protein